MRNMEVPVRASRAAGLYVDGGIVYTVSPVHTDEYYARKARELVALGVDAVFLKDPSGLLTPERTRTLIPALRAAVGAVPLQLHSHCLTGEVFGSMRCDCGGQLELAMEAIAQEGRGLVIYEFQEGRGIGLMAKLRAYELQDAGIDTIEANHALGFKADFRDFSLAAAILHDLRIPRVRLLTNNQRMELMNVLAPAINSGAVKVEVTGPLF